MSLLDDVSTALMAVSERNLYLERQRERMVERIDEQSERIDRLTKRAEKAEAMYLEGQKQLEAERGDFDRLVKEGQKQVKDLHKQLEHWKNEPLYYQLMTLTKERDELVARCTALGMNKILAANEGLTQEVRNLKSVMLKLEQDYDDVQEERTQITEANEELRKLSSKTHRPNVQVFFDGQCVFSENDEDE